MSSVPTKDAEQENVSLLQKAVVFTNPTLRKRIERCEVGWTKEEALKVFFWTKQVLAIIVGVIFGVVPVVGLIGLALFFGILLSFTGVYLAQLMIPDEIADSGDAMKEGTAPAVGGFLLAWIVTYTFVHY